jgi:hypothetical protein
MRLRETCVFVCRLGRLLGAILKRRLLWEICGGQSCIVVHREAAASIRDWVLAGMFSRC